MYEVTYIIIAFISNWSVESNHTVFELLKFWSVGTVVTAQLLLHIHTYLKGVTLCKHKGPDRQDHMILHMICAYSLA
jgi:hypothetical protein